MKKLLLFFVCTMFLAAGALAQATLYVDANYEDDVSDGTQGKPYVSIQAAINAAASGDKILVALGDYSEVLTITKSIAITGMADGDNRPVVSPPTEAIPSKLGINEIIWIMADQGKLVPTSPLEVSIAGLELDGMGEGLVYAGIVSRDANLTLDNVFIHNIGDAVSGTELLPEIPYYGINILEGKLTLINNIIIGQGKGYTGAGVRAYLSGSTARINPTDPDLIAQGNLIENFMDGIYLAIGEGQMAVINGQNIIQNNENGVSVAPPMYKKIVPAANGETTTPLVFINDNTIQGNYFGVMNRNYEVNGGNGKAYKRDPAIPNIDAKFNYWGTENGPGFVGIPDKIEFLANGVSDGVWYSPWLGFPPDTNPGDMTYYVDETGSIQEAIDLASAGDIVRVLGGEYEGAIVVGEGAGLTLYPGDSPACVVIDGDLTVAGGNTLAIDIQGTEPKCVPIRKIDTGNYTQIIVYGKVDLGGITLDLNLGFAPKIGDQFEILKSNYRIDDTFSQGESITVEYEGMLYTFDIIYNPLGGTPVKDNGNSVVITLDDISEPLAIPISDWAIALGMLLMAGFVAFRFKI